MLEEPQKQLEETDRVFDWESDEPEHPDEWQFAVDNAAAMMLLEFAKDIRLLAGPGVDFDRCSDLLVRGARRGVVPQREHVEMLVVFMMDGGTEEIKRVYAGLLWEHLFVKIRGNACRRLTRPQG